VRSCGCLFVVLFLSCCCVCDLFLLLHRSYIYSLVDSFGFDHRCGGRSQQHAAAAATAHHGQRQPKYQNEMRIFIYMRFICHIYTNCWTVFFAIVGVVAGPSIMQQRQLQLITGNANPNLAGEIAARLGVPLTPAKISRFPDGEVSIQILENVSYINLSLYI